MSEPFNTEIQGPSIEQVAMGKLTDPFSEPYPLWHGTDLNKLVSIFREGIIAGDFAKRIMKKDFDSQFGKSWNKRYISLRRGDSVGGLGFGDTVLLIDSIDDVTKPSSRYWKPWSFIKPIAGEYWVKNRIAPREFKGIQISEGSKISKTIQEIVAIFEDIDPQLSLPIYTSNGLVWPEKLSKEELRKRVKAA